MRLNTKLHFPHGYTHEGAPAAAMKPEQAIRRSIMSCLLWESGFYESGEEIGKRIERLAKDVSVETLASLAVEAREHARLRHVPLLLLSCLAHLGRGNPIVATTIERVIQRADELGELLVVHAKINGVEPGAVKKIISAQMKKGLARAFRKFDEYQLAKYDRAGSIRLRDVLFLCHAKPKDDEQDAIWKRLIAGKLAVPDTWEVRLSSGSDKRETFERLIRDGNLGYLALLRNLRNIVESGCDPTLVANYILARKGAHRVLPFRYIAAARAAPQLEPILDRALCASIDEQTRFSGVTAILVDVSGSMTASLSSKADMNRMDAAATLAAIWPGDARLFTFSNTIVKVPARRGMAGVDAIIMSQAHGSTYLGQAVNYVNSIQGIDRLVVITDEQSHDPVPPPKARRSYMINVASDERGVGYGRWTHIEGFSENVLRFIAAAESEQID